MRRLVVALVPALWVALIFVASDGDDSAAGTMLVPFATLEHAQEAAAPGDTVWIRGGEYKN